jgi:hypothetical protein
MTAFAEGPNNDALARFEQGFYALIKDDIKQQYDRFVAKYTEEAAKKNATTQEQQHDTQIAISWLKDTSYYRANAMVTCASEIRRTATPAEEQSQDMTRYQSCVKERMNDWMIFNKLSEYASLLPREARVRCELEARLFEREILLPPYDFLKGAQLIDYRVYNQCVRSKN